MKRLFKCIILFGIALLMSNSLFAAGLIEYVEKPDDSFKWEVVQNTKDSSGTYARLKMTSQTWQDIAWQHSIEIFIPENPNTRDTAILYVATQTDAPGSPESTMCKQLSSMSKNIVILLDGIPQQPLYGLKEDALIAYTFQKTLDTGDTDWPLLLPMTKSVVKAMDAVQAYTQDTLGHKIKDFIVGGASKRGWTTWLTAGADPARTRAIIPIVYDNLDIPAQMAQQVLYFKGYSNKISPYEALGIEEQLNTAKGKALIDIVDPWTYRSRITMPKLIVNGTNDPYWTVDGLNLYWDGLSGPKQVIYIPNAGHDLGMSNLGAGTFATAAKLFSTITSFVNIVSEDKPLPNLDWKYVLGNKAYRLNLTSKDSIESANIWEAVSPTADFREAKWETTPMTKDQSGYTYKIDAPESGYKAVYAEVTVKSGDISMPVCTQIKLMQGSK